MTPIQRRKWREGETSKIGAETIGYCVSIRAALTADRGPVLSFRGRAKSARQKSAETGASGAVMEPVGNIGRAAAAAVVAGMGAAQPDVADGENVTNGKARPDTDKGSKRKSLLSFLGQPTFIMGDGKRYPRQTGWGQNKKANPDGGTNETIGWVVFKPTGLDGISFEGRVYLERFQKVDGVDLPKERRIYSVSLPFVTREKRNAAATEAYESACDKVLDSYLEWAKSAPAIAASTAKTAEKRGVRVFDGE